MRLNKFFYMAVLLGLSLPVLATDFYVSPSGNDQANGLFATAAKQGPNGPFKTLGRAQSAIRALKTTGTFNQPVTVHVAPGNYQQNSALQFDLRDSGAAGKEITWTGAGLTTVISGGITLNNCKSASGMWSCPTAGLGLDGIQYPNTGLKIGNIPGFNLFVNQQRMTLARWPDTDWAHIKIPANQSTTFTSFEQLPAIQAEVAHAQVHIMTSDWYDQYLPVKSVVQTQNQITLGANTNQALASGYRFYLQNLQSQLNAPSEWFYDQPNARILFIAPTGVMPQNIVVSALPNLITMNGVGYVAFQNMVFQDTTNDAISLINSNNLLFNNLDISNVDNNGIKMDSCTNVTVSNSHIHDTGAMGLYLWGGNRTTLAASNYLVNNNHFDHQAAIIIMSNVISTSGVGSRIANNLIEQSPGPGIIIYGNDHVIEKNEIRNVCMQESDCGAIYSGRDWSYRGNIVRYNSIHDILGYGLQSVDVIHNIVKYVTPANTAGIYADDAVSSFSIIGNILNNSGLFAILIGGGRDNVIENNVINTFNNNYAIYTDNRWPTFNWAILNQNLSQVPYTGSTWSVKYPALAQPMKNPSWPEGNIIQNNVLIANTANSTLFHYFLPKESSTLANNLVWATNGSGMNVSYAILDESGQNIIASWQNWLQLGIEKNSINANPCATISGNRVSFCTSSPINKIGFQALPTDIGLIN